MESDSLPEKIAKLFETVCDYRLTSMPTKPDAPIQCCVFAPNPGGGDRQDFHLRNIASVPEIARSYEAIVRFFSKFQFGRTLDEIWSNQYTFPSSKTMEHYRKLYAKSVGLDLDQFRTSDPEDSWVANKSPRHAELTTENYVKWARRQERCTFFILGGVGSGKSSFVKYTLSQFRNKFIDSKVIPSRVESRKLLGHLARLGFPRSAELGVYLLSLNDYLVRNLVRDVVHYAYLHTGDGLHFQHVTLNPARSVGRALPVRFKARSGFPCVFSNEFSRYVEEISGDRTQPAKCREFLSRYLKQILMDGGEIRADVSSVLNSVFGSGEGNLVSKLIVGFFYANNVRFCLYFDGFDYIEAADFLFATARAEVISLLALWLRSGETDGRLDLSPATPAHLAPTVIMTLRDNTFSLFHRNYLAAMGLGEKQSRVRVIPPSFEKLFRKVYGRALARIGAGQIAPRRESANRAITRGLFEQSHAVRKSIRQELKLRELALPSLFSDNVRNQIGYAKFVHMEITSDAISTIKRRGISSNVELSASFLEAVKDEIAQRSYRLVELLLFSSNRRFCNFVRIADLSALADAVKSGSKFAYDMSDNDLDSGYIGNIFNYHIEYTKLRDVEFLLEKVRILELLDVQGRTERSLIDQFERAGWAVSPLFRTSLWLLVREGFVKVEGVEKDAPYKISELGSVALRRLMTHNIYLENVFFGIVMPTQFFDAASDITRGQDNTRAWAKAAVKHLFLFLLLIDQAERTFSKSVEARRFVVCNILPSVLHAVRVILRREAGFPGGLSRLQDLSNELCSAIELRTPPT